MVLITLTLSQEEVRRDSTECLMKIKIQMPRATLLKSYAFKQKNLERDTATSAAIRITNLIGRLALYSLTIFMISCPLALVAACLWLLFPQTRLCLFSAENSQKADCLTHLCQTPDFSWKLDFSSTVAQSF